MRVVGMTNAGKPRHHDVVETVMPARNGFGYFPRKESDPLAQRGTSQTRPTTGINAPVIAVA